MQWPTLLVELHGPAAQGQTKALYEACFAHKQRRGSWHRGPHGNQQVVIEIGKVVEVQENFEIMDEKAALSEVGKPRMTQLLAAGIGTADLPEQLGIGPMRVFAHPSLPAKSLHVKSQYLVLNQDVVKAQSELMYAEHASDDWQHRVRQAVQQQLVLPATQGGETKHPLSVDDWKAAHGVPKQAVQPANTATLSPAQIAVATKGNPVTSPVTNKTQQQKASAQRTIVGAAACAFSHSIGQGLVSPRKASGSAASTGESPTALSEGTPSKLLRLKSTDNLAASDDGSEDRAPDLDGHPTETFTHFFRYQTCFGRFQMSKGIFRVLLVLMCLACFLLLYSKSIVVFYIQKGDDILCWARRKVSMSEILLFQKDGRQLKGPRQFVKDNLGIRERKTKAQRLQQWIGICEVALIIRQGNLVGIDNIVQKLELIREDP